MYDMPLRGSCTGTLPICSFAFKSPQNAKIMKLAAMPCCADQNAICCNTL